MSAPDETTFDLKAHLRDDLALLRDTEWSGWGDVYVEGDPEPLSHLPSCPKCGQFQYMPKAITIGDKWDGYGEIEPHPDHFLEIGHTEDCKLAARIKALETALL
jgi:hypothetical protein